MPRSDEAASPQALVEHIVACWRTQALHVAARLDLPDALAAGARHPAELAPSLGCDADALERLLHALCTLGVCDQEEDGRFALSTAGRRLCRDGGGQGASLRPLALWWGGPLWPMFGALEHSVRTGRSAREHLTGDRGYGHLAGDADRARTFHEAMEAMTALVLDDLVALPLWRGARQVVDVGGGHGQVALALAAAHAGLQATVFDRADAAAGAWARIAAAGLSARCRFETGSFFEAIPAGADVYLLKSILHNWDDAACAHILRRCRAAAPPGAQLVVVERLRSARPVPGFHDQGVARTDLNMLAGLGGRERSVGQYQGLLQQAGFSAAEPPVDTAFEFSVLVAR